LSDKPHEFLETYQRASGRGYGAGLVPLLEHGVNLIIESDVVAKYVSQNIPGRDGKGEGLYPKSKEGEELMELFVDKWNRVTDTYYNVLCATSEKEVQRHILSYIQSLEAIDNLLQHNNDGDYFLLGSDFSYAECISAPWVQRFYVTLPYFRGIDFEEEILSKFDHLSVWMREVCNRPSCVDSKCPEEEMIAACKRYYVSYLSPGASGSL